MKILSWFGKRPDETGQVGPETEGGVLGRILLSWAAAHAEQEVTTLVYLLVVQRAELPVAEAVIVLLGNDHVGCMVSCVGKLLRTRGLVHHGDP